MTYLFTCEYVFACIFLAVFITFREYPAPSREQLCGRVSIYIYKAEFCPCVCVFVTFFVTVCLFVRLFVCRYVCPPFKFVRSYVRPPLHNGWLLSSFVCTSPPPLQVCLFVRMYVPTRLKFVRSFVCMFVCLFVCTSPSKLVLYFVCSYVCPHSSKLY